MSESLRNTVLLLIIVLLVVGVSGYYTDIKLPAERAEIEQRHADALRDLEELQRMEAEADAEATFVSELRLRKEYPYRTVRPLYSTDYLVDFLAPTTGRDYEGLELSPEGTRVTSLAEVGEYSLKGNASFDEIYELVWRLENEREFHRVRQLNLIGDRYSRAVDFDMILEAYSSPELAAFFTDTLAIEIPDDSLALEEPDDNPFRPLIIIPPPSPTNPDMVNVRTASLVAIAGGRAVFRDATGVHMLQAGDAVASGSIQNVDQTTREVVVLLTENGTQRSVTLRLNQ